VAVAAFLLLRAGTSPLDLLRYAAYVVFAVVLPGTLVFRTVRTKPHTLVEDLAMGAAVGLVLELGGWALFSWLDLRPFVWLWPLLIVVPFLVLPRLRRHWWVTGYTRVPVGWSWAVAGVVAFFTTYLAAVFLDRNPILPPTTRPGSTSTCRTSSRSPVRPVHAIPPGVPQVAEEPLYYHWFAYVHMAMTGMVGHIDLPVVALRLAIPALCALAIVLTAVVGWRVSGRPYAGAVAAALFFAVGEFNFTDPVTLPFGTQATFVVWHGMSMIYAWVLVIALIAPLASLAALSGAVPPLGRRGVWVLLGLLLLGNSGAKGSSLPVVALALALTVVMLVVTERRIPWAWWWPACSPGRPSCSRPSCSTTSRRTAWPSASSAGSVPIGPDRWDRWRASLLAFVLNMLLRTAGIGPLLWFSRGPREWLLVAGGVAGLVCYLVLSQPGSGNQYFLRTGFAFAVIASGWGYVLVWERARLPRRAAVAVGVGTAAYALVLCGIQLAYAGSPPPSEGPIGPLLPMLWWAVILGWVLVLGALGWTLAGRRWPALHGRGAVLLLTGLLVAGAPGLVMDAAKSIRVPNGGPYPSVPLPKSRVDAARWVRDHSSPDDILATNAHCLSGDLDSCDSARFWLSRPTPERSVLIEGWGFAPAPGRGGTDRASGTPRSWRSRVRRSPLPRRPPGRACAESKGCTGWSWTGPSAGIGATRPASRAVYDNGRDRGVPPV
jgi:hypothetical protein